MSQSAPDEPPITRTLASLNLFVCLTWSVILAVWTQILLFLIISLLPSRSYRAVYIHPPA